MSTPFSLGNAHSRRKGLIHAYGSDSTSASGTSDVDDVNPHDDSGEFRQSHWRKRRRTGKEARDNAALGVFGSDSEYEDGRYRGSHNPERSLRAHQMRFKKAQGEDLSMGDNGDGGSGVHMGGEGKAKTGEPAEEDLSTSSGFGRRSLVDKAGDACKDSAGRGGFDAVKRIRRLHRGLGAAYTEDKEQDSYNTPQDQEWPQPGPGRSLGIIPGVQTFSPEMSTCGGTIPSPVTSGVSTITVDRQGLGSTGNLPASFESPLGPGFVSSIARQRRQDPVLASPQ